jgi:hypothetical protein
LTHKPDDKTRNQVRQLSGLGVVINDIATIIGISDVTVRKYYSPDITKGRAEADLQVSRALFRAATRGEPNVAACIFWLKNRRPDLWRDRIEQDHSGGIMLQHEVIDRPPAETREQWIERRQRELAVSRLALAAPVGNAD